MLRAPVALAAVIALGLTPAAATAQSDDATASVTVADAGDVTVVNTAGLSFGTHAAGTTVHSSNVPTAASWNLGFNTDRNYAITFTLPSVLTSATGGTVPISFGNTSASSPALEFPFDPETGLGVQVMGTPVSVDFFLGADVQGDGSGDVSVNLSGAAAGTYTGTITLTVAPL